MPTTRLKFEKVRKAFRVANGRDGTVADVVAVEDVSLSAGDGEVAAGAFALAKLLDPGSQAAALGLERARVADRVADEHVEPDAVRERDLQRRLDNGAEVGAEPRLRLGGVDRGAAHLDRQHAGGVREFFREVDLEVAEHLAAVLAPERARRKVAVLRDVAGFAQDPVEGLAAPFE